MPVRRYFTRLWQVLDAVGEQRADQELFPLGLAGPLAGLLAQEIITGGGDNAGPIGAGTTLQTITLVRGWYYLSGSIAASPTATARVAFRLVDPAGIARWTYNGRSTVGINFNIILPHLFYVGDGNWAWETRLLTAIVAGDLLTSTLNALRVYQEDLSVSGTAAV